MLKRILTGIILVVVLLAFLLCGYFVSPIFVDMLVYIFLLGSVYEMFSCLKGAGYKLFILPIAFVLISSYPTFYLMQHYLGLGLQGLLIVFLIAVMLALTQFTFRAQGGKNKDKVSDAPDGEVKLDEIADIEGKEGKSGYLNGQNNDIAAGAYSIKDLFANAFILLYPILFFTVAWVISYKYSALFALTYAIVVPVIGGDMCAYFFGSFIGGKKLCPKISPKKTVSGFVGALIGGMIVSILFWVVFEVVGSDKFVATCGYVPFISHSDSGYLYKSALIYLAIGLICGAVSEVGDLAASSIKRAIGIKDYGKIFPGHGGFLDRIDSVMYCLVVLLIAFSAIYGY